MKTAIMDKAIAAAKRTDIGAVEARQLVRQIREHADNLRKLLTKLRDRRGWMPLGYLTWAACCEGEFGYTKQHTNRLIKAEEVRQSIETTSQVEPIGSTPSTHSEHNFDPLAPVQLPESQSRELAKAPAEQRSEVLNRVIEKTDGKVTAAAIKEEVAAHEPEVAAVEPSVENRKAKPPTRKPAATIRISGSEHTEAFYAQQQTKLWSETIGRWLGQTPSIDEYRNKWPGPAGDRVVKAATELFEALKRWKREIK